MTLKCTDTMAAGMVADARTALDHGELRRAVNLLYGAGERDVAVAAEKMEEANKYHGTAALALALTGDLEAAFTKVLTAMEKTLGPNHADLALALNNLAFVHYAQGRYDDDEPLYRRALAIDEKALGKEHASVTTDLNNLGLLYKKQERFKDAEPLFKRALAIKEKTLGPGDPGLINGFRNYASLLRSMDRIKEAAAMEDRAQAMEAPRGEEKEEAEEAEAAQ